MPTHDPTERPRRGDANTQFFVDPAVPVDWRDALRAVQVLRTLQHPAYRAVLSRGYADGNGRFAGVVFTFVAGDRSGTARVPARELRAVPAEELGAQLRRLATLLLED